MTAASAASLLTAPSQPWGCNYKVGTETLCPNLEGVGGSELPAEWKASEQEREALGVQWAYNESKEKKDGSPDGSKVMLRRHGTFTGTD